LKKWELVGFISILFKCISKLTKQRTLITGPRPIMPTAQICSKFENLQNSILTLFELKKVVDKTDAEHKVKVQKGRDGTPTGRVRIVMIHNSNN
jgi:hypothetical protein